MAKFILIILAAMTALYPSSSHARIFRDIAYGQDPQQVMDIYVPDRPKGIVALKNRLLPVHVFVHGGGWNNGDKSTVSISDSAPYLQKQIIVISVNYRLAPKNPYPDFMNDVAAATNWIVKNIANYGGDASNMVLSGHSAGAHMVALHGLDGRYLAQYSLKPSLWRSIVPVDTATFDLTKPQEGKLRFLISRMRDRAFGEDPEVLKAASPITYIAPNKAVPPFILFATGGRADAVAANKDLADRLTKSGYKASVTIMNADFTHADMKDQIFIKDSPIFNAISASFK